MSVECPIECTRASCPDAPDWLEKHGTFILTMAGGFTACVGVVLTYFLKSRCKRIDICGLKCDREVIDLDPKEVEIVSNTA